MKISGYSLLALLILIHCAICAKKHDHRHKDHDVFRKPSEKLAHVMNDFERVLEEGRKGIVVNFDSFVHRTKRQLPQVERYMRDNWHAYTKLVQKAAHGKKVSRSDTVDFRSAPDLLADSIRAAYNELKFRVEKELSKVVVEVRTTEKRKKRDLAMFHDDEIVARGFHHMVSHGGFGMVAVDVGMVLLVAILLQGYRGQYGMFRSPFDFFATSFALFLTNAASGIAFYQVQGTAHLVSGIVAYLSALALFVQLVASLNLPSSYMDSSFRGFTAVTYRTNYDKTTRRLVPPLIENQRPEMEIRTFQGSCSICLEEILPILFILPCGHPYHRSCILQWAELQRVCPVCKVDFDRIIKLESDVEENDTDKDEAKSE